MGNVLAIIACIAVAICIAVIVILRRRAAAAQAAQRVWSDTIRHLTVELNRLSSSSSRADHWPKHLCDLLQTAFEARGAVIYDRIDAGSDTIASIHICGHAGHWPQLPDEDEPVLQLAAGIPNDFFWSRRPLIYRGSSVQSWLPEALSGDIESALVAPLTVSKKQQYFVLLYRRADDPAFSATDQQLMAECIGQIELALRVIIAIRDRKAAEKALAKAHEEGMLQISTGIIHNIGNAITVIQLALGRLHSEDLRTVGELVDLLDSEMLPILQKHQEDGTLAHFLTEDPQGREYFGAIQEMILQIRKVMAQQSEDIDFITEKFQNITEIISLQQQFIGELGTENVVATKTLLEDVVKMAHGPLDQRDITLNTDIMARGRILVDPAMMRHIILMLLKYAIESVTASRKVAPTITIAALETRVDDRSMVRITITDNGAGLSIDLDNLERRLDEAPNDERVRDLLFCRRRIAKYGGQLTMSSDMARGLRVQIEIPEYVPDESGPAADKAEPEKAFDPEETISAMETAPSGLDETMDDPIADDETMNVNLEETREEPTGL